MLDIVELKPTVGLSEHVKEICCRDVKLGIAVVEMLVSATTLMRLYSEECGREEKKTKD